jgi:hypothetical protein
MNTARRIATRPRVDRRHRSMMLCDEADAAVSKGDLELAQRLLIQANVDNPRNSYPEARLKQVERKINIFRILTNFRRKPKRSGRRFDFLYAPTLRGLSTELSSLLPLHPKVFCVSKGELDAAIADNAEPALLAKYQRQLKSSWDRISAGLVQHAYIAGQRGDPKVAEKLATVTTRKLFIHGVRDPLRLVVSEFNHELIARYCGDYAFWPIFSDSPFGRTEYTLADHPQYKRVIKQSSLEIKLPTKETMQTLLTESLPRARHFAIGETYARHFDSWVPVNLERPPAGKPGVLRRIFAAIGVDANFNHPGFKSSEGTTVHRLMVQNWITVDAFGHRLLVGLGYADRMMFSNTFLMSEMLAFEPDARFAAVGLGDRPLCLIVPHGYWRLLPRDVRIRLVESDYLERVLTSIVIPAWLESYSRWRSIMDKYLIQELESPVLARLRDAVGPDLERFIKRHPHFERAWHSSRVLMG